MAIKAITIDFWNTLYDSSSGPERTRQREQIIQDELARLQARVASERLREAQKAVWEHFNIVWERDHVTLGTADLVKFYLEYLAVRFDRRAVETITAVFEEGILHHPPELLPGALETLTNLAERYPLALISDTAFSPGRILKQVMERTGIARHFAKYSFSDETGVSKPHPRAFATAIQTLPVQPEECIHIGDIERTDIAGAKNFGMRAILFKGDVNPWIRQPNPSETQADASAESWSEIPAIIESLNEA